MAQRFFLVLVIAAVTGASTAFLAITLRDNQSAPPIVIEDDPSQSDVIVWVGGAVATPGIYKLPSGSRLNDAVTAAGGLTGTADAQALNLAERIEDEDRIEVPFVEAALPVEVSTAQPSFGIKTDSPPTAEPTDDRININTADSAQLESLPGIGPALANRIIAFRTDQGPFTRIEELAQVDGISTGMVEEMRDLITVGS